MHMNNIVFIMSLIVFMGCDILELRKNLKETEGNSTTYNIAVIPKGEQHDFWRTVRRGATDAAVDTVGFNWKLRWRSPVIDDSVEGQIDRVEQLVQYHVKGKMELRGIVIAPLHEEKLIRSLTKARSIGIPVLIMDSALSGVPGKDYVQFTRTDSYKAGEAAASAVLKIIEDKYKNMNKKTVRILRYSRGSASTTRREHGFFRGFTSSLDNVDIAFHPDDGGASIETATDESKKLLKKLEEDKLIKSDEPVVIFTPNESTTEGMSLAIVNKELQGKVLFVGFDVSRPLLDCLESGIVSALIVQNAYEIGKRSFENMMEYIQCEEDYYTANGK